MKLVTILVFVLFSIAAQAYPNFIGHSYTSCLNCHFNPFGGGPLNDYGRAVGATLISSDKLYPKSWTEEKIAYLSGFLFRKPKQDWLRTQINYRGFQLVKNPQSTSAETKRWINMQADARLILKFGQNDRFVGVMNYGYAPLPPGTQLPDGNESEWRSREHYVGFKFTPNIGLYAGLMDKVYGLRVIEHIAYARSVPQITQNDQVHGAALHFLTEKWEGGLHAFAGNMNQEKELQMKGGSFMFERTVGTHRIGASVQKASNEFLDLFSYSGHGRFNLKDGSALLAELGQTTKKAKAGTEGITSRQGLLQTYLRPYRGVYFLTNIEYNSNNIEQDDYSVRWGPALQTFPIQKLEIRFDVYNTRNFSPNSSAKDSWQYLLQTHIWL